MLTRKPSPQRLPRPQGGGPLSLFEKTVYPRLSASLDTNYLALHFTPSEDEIAFSNNNARRPSSRLSLLTLLKLFQLLHRFPRPKGGAAGDCGSSAYPFATRILRRVRLNRAGATCSTPQRHSRVHRRHGLVAAGSSSRCGNRLQSLSAHASSRRYRQCRHRRTHSRWLRAASILYLGTHHQARPGIGSSQSMQHRPSTLEGRRTSSA